MGESTRLRLEAVVRLSRSPSGLRLAVSLLLAAVPAVSMTVLMFWRDFRCFFPCFLGY